MRISLTLLCTLTLVLPPLVLGADGRNGKLFDPGVSMDAKSPGAPQELDAITYVLGDWDVEVETTTPDGETRETTGVAAITFMNRGHAVMERLYVSESDADGNESHEIRFLAFNPGANLWNLGEASSYTESARAMHGSIADGVLTLHDAERPGGRPTLHLWRTTYRRDGAGFVVTQAVSADLGETFEPRVRRRYRERESRADVLVPASDWGAPASERPEGADGFDFLIGLFDANQWMLFGGRELTFATSASAVYALGGHAILEFHWFDLDPNLPDAATTVLRIYNRAERQWESLFINNRFGSMLHFGGRQEGERIVLTTFDVDSTDTLSRFVFHSIDEDGYRWFAESSTDRGASYNKTWTIDVTRRSE